uniref:Uncharacterized protein n=1 Tax=Arundo donax TaxID=35708 RepID=A0A0A9CNN9_ARUDO
MSAGVFSKESFISWTCFEILDGSSGGSCESLASLNAVPGTSADPESTIFSDIPVFAAPASISRDLTSSFLSTTFISIGFPKFAFICVSSFARFSSI